MKKFFALVYWGAIIAEMFVRMPYEQKRAGIAKTDQRVSRQERALLGGLALGMMVLPLAYSLTGWLDFANYRLSERVKGILGGLGSAFLGASVWLFWRSHRDLGTNWSPSLEIGAEHRLVTEGVYGTVRHPMYASQLLWSIAQALLLHNWVAGPAGLVTFLPLYFVRVPQEERMMQDHFGEQYTRYRQSTGGILPRLWG